MLLINHKLKDFFSKGFLFVQSRSFILLFFIALILYGCMVYTDYGISWDEPLVSRHGLVIWDYVFHSDDTLLSDRARYHGSIIPFLVVLLEKSFSGLESQTLYYFRHLCSYLFYVFGLFFFYRLCFFAFCSRVWSLVSLLFLLLSPRLLGHSFYNPKDIPFMAIFIIGVYCLVRF